ncbi:M23 family peptidase [bacterium 1xD8-48]|jgi:murein DD-endopeptidase MepM/ murein hydrolase activator NlpD|nr:peptidoglycan DD-metalloendopeptidase family protein [Lachnospiraceae bacterium]NBJ98513.1 M23 family peptidase [bacterium 1xD8-48]
MRRNRRKGLAKERFLMVASAVLVLGSLTATGLWLGRDGKNKDEEYVVDLSEIENGSTGRAGENEGTLAESVRQEISTNDLDYDPYFQETNSQKVENPDESDSASMSDGAMSEDGDRKADEKGGAGQGAAVENESAEAKSGENETGEQPEEEAGEGTPALSTAMQPALTFSDSDTLIWPVVGNILVNYSMDKTVYFPTLQQYKYNPAIIIQANQGDLITAASAGKVISVFSDPQIGNGVTMELGGGYEVTYGQLTNILVSEGSYVATGDVIAEVAAPTKYFSVEGTNVYFKLTKDGEPVNPMTKLS